MALGFAVACGCGDARRGAPESGAPGRAYDPPEVVLSAAQLYGEQSPAGHATTKPVLLRLTDNSLQVIDFGENAAPDPFSAAPVFSSVNTVWAVGGARNDPSRSLLRSDDLGSSWRIVADLPMASVSALSLHVEPDAQGTLTAWVAFRNSDEFFPGGPRVFARPVDRDAPWTEVSGIPSGPALRTAVLARRGRNLELLRQAGGLFGGDDRIAIDAISGQVATPLQRLDLPFLADDYATFQDCGWVAGIFGLEDGTPAVLSSCGASNWEVRVLRGVAAGGRTHSIDFADPRHGVICGDEYLPGSFCFFTGDGGTSWSRSEVPPTQASLHVVDVTLGPDGKGLATLGTGGLHAGLLSTGDGGQTWHEMSLPPLASRVRFVRLARRSKAPDWNFAVDEPPVAHTPLPSPAATPSTTSFPAPAAAGPRAWAIGDSADRGPTITALLLYSDDAGRTWNEVLAVPGGSFSGITFIDRRIGWVVGAGRVFHTTDGGASFVEQTEAARTSEPLSRPFRVSAADAHRALLTSSLGVDDVLLFTADGGASWEPSRVAARPPGENRLEGGVCLTRTGAGIAVSYTDVLLTTDGGASWVAGPSFDFLIEGEGFSIAGSGFTGPLVACSDDSDLWILVAATDPRGETLWHSPDGGVSWRNLTGAIGRTPELGPTVGGFAGDGSALLVVPHRSQDQLEDQLALLRTRDGGDSWLEVPNALAPSRDSFSSELPEAIAFANPSLGMMLTTVLDYSRPSTARHSVLTTRDGSDSWERSELPPDFQPLGLSFVP